MGKSYSLWDGNKKIGDIYEKDSPVDTLSQKNMESMLNYYISQMDDLIREEEEERLYKEQKKQIYNSMSESKKMSTMKK